MTGPWVFAALWALAGSVVLLAAAVAGSSPRWQPRIVAGAGIAGVVMLAASALAALILAATT